MIPALIIFVSLLIVAGVGAYFVPIVVRPRRGTASNFLFHISLPKSLAYSAAVLAQERYEQQWKLRHLIFFGSKREMELMSHAIECAAVGIIYGDDAQVYAVAEAERMFDAIPRSYGHLGDMVPASIHAALITRLPQASAWVLANRKLLEGYR